MNKIYSDSWEVAYFVTFDPNKECDEYQAARILSCPLELLRKAIAEDIAPPHRKLNGRAFFRQSDIVDLGCKLHTHYTAWLASKSHPVWQTANDN